MTRMNLMRILAVAGALTAALPVLAHHSFSAEFDSTKKVRLEGKVVKMEWSEIENAAPQVVLFMPCGYYLDGAVAESTT